VGVFSTFLGGRFDGFDGFDPFSVTFGTPKLELLDPFLTPRFDGFDPFLTVLTTF